jgi:hypothetical protein
MQLLSFHVLWRIWHSVLVRFNKQKLCSCMLLLNLIAVHIHTGWRFSIKENLRKNSCVLRIWLRSRYSSVCIAKGLMVRARSPGKRSFYSSPCKYLYILCVVAWLLLYMLFYCVYVLLHCLHFIVLCCYYCTMLLHHLCIRVLAYNVCCCVVTSMRFNVLCLRFIVLCTYYCIVYVLLYCVVIIV